MALHPSKRVFTPRRCDQRPECRPIPRSGRRRRESTGGQWWLSPDGRENHFGHLVASCRRRLRMSEPPSFNRRRFCGVAAATVAAGQLGLFGFSRRVEAMTEVMTGVAPRKGSGPTDIRPFRVKFFRRGTKRATQARQGDKVAREGDGHGCLARRAARDDTETRALLGHRTRLAQGRGETEFLPAVHH